MSDYQTWTRRDVLHVDGWGWRVELSEFGCTVVEVVDGEEPAADAKRWEFDPDGARALAAAIVAAVGDWERMEGGR